MTLQKTWVLRWALLLGALIFAFAAYVIADMYEWMAFGIVLLVLSVTSFAGYFVVSILFWRCPTCRKMLPMKGVGNLSYCPCCGEELGLSNE